MANRHKAQKAAGGRVFYAGGDSNVAKEAFARKHGGKVVGKMEGGAAKHRLDKRARGGRVGSQQVPMTDADKQKANEYMNAMGQSRARGGRVGADKSPMAPGVAKHPFSSAKKG